METPSLFDHGKIPTRKELRARLQEIKELLPRAGAVARRLREKRKMSERDLAKAVGVMPRDIMRLEREGLVRVLVDPRLRGYGSIADPEQLPRDNSKLERFLEILEPNLHERAVLLQDISGELHDELIAVAIELMDEGYGIDFTWPDTKRTVFADPWQEEDKPRPSKRQRAPVPAISAARAAGSSASSSSCGSHPVGGSRQVGTEGADAAPLQRPVPVNVRFQVVVADASGQETTVEVMTLDKQTQGPESVGLTLGEAKRLLRGVQRTVVQKQVDAYIAARTSCASCERSLKPNGRQSLTLRTLFGNVPVGGPRMKRCQCDTSTQPIAQPLRELLPENTTPEMLFMEAKWSSLVSYGLAPRILKDLLPVDARLNADTVRRHTLMIAERRERNIEQRDRDSPEETSDVPQHQVDDHGPVNVGLDGAYLRQWGQRRGKFEVLVGRSAPSDGKPVKCFGTVHTIDENPKRRIRDVLQSQGVRHGPQIRCMADGEDVLRSLQKSLLPDAAHILDWFHVTMRLTVLRQYIKGIVKLEKDAVPAKYAHDSVGHELQQAWTSTKWKLWHGKVDDALERLRTLQLVAFRVDPAYPRRGKFLKAIGEFRTYVVNNRGLIPNYGELWRSGEVISTATIESLVCSLIGRRFAKKQQMQWTPKGAHLLLQVRTTVANGDLPSVFQSWYPGFNADGHHAVGDVAYADLAA